MQQQMDLNLPIISAGNMQTQEPQSPWIAYLGSCKNSELFLGLFQLLNQTQGINREVLKTVLSNKDYPRWLKGVPAMYNQETLICYYGDHAFEVLLSYAQEAATTRQQQQQQQQQQSMHPSGKMPHQMAHGTPGPSLPVDASQGHLVAGQPSATGAPVETPSRPGDANFGGHASSWIDHEKSILSFYNPVDDPKCQAEAKKA